MTNAPREFRQIQFAAPPGATELILVRHGESEAVREGEPVPLVDGHSDPALHEDGIAQAERVGARLASERIDAIYVTPLRRTHQTAAPLAAHKGLEPVVVEELREVHLGEWEGGSFRRHVVERHPIAVQMAAEQRWDVIPGAEPAHAFASRVHAGVERVVAAHPDGRVVVVTHGGVIGEILRQATDSRPFAFTGADNASISHVVVTAERWIVRRYNDTSHLESELTAAPEPLT